MKDTTPTDAATAARPDDGLGGQAEPANQGDDAPSGTVGTTDVTPPNGPVPVEAHNMPEAGAANPGCSRVGNIDDAAQVNFREGAQMNIRVGSQHVVQ